MRVPAIQTVFMICNEGVTTAICVAGNETVSNIAIGSAGGALQTIQNVAQVRIFIALTRV